MLSYSKRGLTDNMIVKVVGNNLDVALDIEQLAALVGVLTAGEMGSQANTCPLDANKELDPVARLCQANYPGLGIRKNQLSAALSVGAVENLAVQAAENLARAGSIVLFAQSYDQASLDALVAAGVLPLIAEEPLAEGTWLFLRGIRNDVIISAKTLNAFTISDVLAPARIDLAFLYPGQNHPFQRDHLAKILED